MCIMDECSSTYTPLPDSPDQCGNSISILSIHIAISIDVSADQPPLAALLRGIEWIRLESSSLTSNLCFARAFAPHLNKWATVRSLVYPPTQGKYWN